MNELFIARDCETGELVTFIGFEDMREFAEDGRKYSHDYFSVPVKNVFDDVERIFNTKEESE